MGLAFLLDLGNEALAIRARGAFSTSCTSHEHVALGISLLQLLLESCKFSLELSRTCRTTEDELVLHSTVHGILLLCSGSLHGEPFILSLQGSDIVIRLVAASTDWPTTRG
jgi:hypothetical protein